MSSNDPTADPSDASAYGVAYALVYGTGDGTSTPPTAPDPTEPTPPPDPTDPTDPDSPIDMSTITITSPDGASDKTTYDFRVSGAYLKKNSHVGTVQTNDVIDGQTATGFVHGGIDAYDYEGDIVEFSWTGPPPVVTIDGTVTPPDEVAQTPTEPPDDGSDTGGDTGGGTGGEIPAAVVGVGAPFQSIQEAIDATEAGTRVHVLSSYSRVGDGPVTITDRRHLSADHGTLIPPVTVETDHKRPPGVLLEGFETESVTIRGSKFCTVRNVHTEPGGGGFETVSTEANSCNSVTFDRCTADRPGGTGFTLGGGSHAARVTDCTVVGAGEYGVYSPGASANVVVDKSQIEDCGKEGVYAEKNNAFVLENSYIEGNGTGLSDGGADIRVTDCPNFTVGGNYFNAVGVSLHAIVIRGECPGRVKRSHTTGYPGNPIDDESNAHVRIE